MSGIPQMDSVAELARFWDSHDLAEFEDELEQVEENVFDRDEHTVVQVRLQPEQAAALHRVAQSKGLAETELVREWVSEKLGDS